MTQPPLPPPAHYFPLPKGRYEVKPGLFRWGHDFGNGARDSQLFQFDDQWSHYHATKAAARRERLDKYVCLADPPPTALATVCAFLAEQLLREQPGLFQWQDHAERADLQCRLSGESLRFDAPGQLDVTTTPAYAHAWDALGHQVQEDLALVELDAAGHSRLAALHLCLPNHWAAEDKIGRSFTAVHDPVADFDAIARREQALMRAVLERGPFVRFAWGLGTDARLNHHPEAPPTWEGEDWHGRRFDSGAPQLYLRVERQVLWGFAQARVIVFSIRTYHYDCARDLNAQQRQLLAAALESMSDASLRYKGLERDISTMTAWLRG